MNQRCTVLIVSSNSDDRDLIRRVLQAEEQRLYEIGVCETGVEALAWCQQTMPDVVLLEEGLPDVAVSEVLKKLRRPMWGDRPLVVVLGSGHEEAMAQALEQGAHDYLDRDRLSAVRLRHAVGRLLKPDQWPHPTPPHPAQPRGLEAIAPPSVTSDPATHPPLTDRALPSSGQPADQQALRTQQAALIELAQAKAFYEGNLVRASQLLTQTAAVVLKVDRVSLWFYNAERTQLLLHDQYDLARQQHSQGLKRWVHEYPAYFERLATENVVAVSQAQTDPRTSELWSTWLQPRDMTSLLQAPVRLRGQTVGVLCLEHGGPPRQWSVEDETFAIYLAHMMSLALESCDRQRIELALQQSETRFRAIFEQAAVGINQADESGRFIQANQRFCDLLGYTKAELLRLTFQDVTHPDDLKLQEEPLRQLFQGKRSSFSLEKRYLCKDGTPVWTNVTLSVIRDEAGQVISDLAIVEDIRDRKRAEAILQDKQQQLAAIAANIPGGVFRFIFHADGSSSCPFASDGYRALTGIDPHQLETDSSVMLNIVHPDDRATYFAALEQAIQQLPEVTQFCGETRFALPSGEVKWIGTQAQLRQEANGDVVIDGIDFDITERKRVELAMRQSETNFRAIFEQAAVGISQTDLSGRFIRVNQRFCDLLGYSEAELLQLTFEDITPPEDWLTDRATQHPLFNPAVQSLTIEKRYIRKDGTLLWAQVNLSAIRDLDSDLVCDLAIVKDISDRKRAEAERQRAEEALKASEAKLNDILNSAIASIVSFRMFNAEEWEYDFQSIGSVALFGYTPDEIILDEALWLSRVLPSDRDTVMTNLLNAIFAEQATTIEYRFRHKDESVRWLEATYTSRRDDDAQCWIVTGVTIDITARKQAELRLQQAERQYRNLIEQSPGVVYTLPISDTPELAYVSPQVQQLLDISPDDWAAGCFQEWRSYIHPDDRDRVHSDIATTMATGIPFSCEYRMITHEGRVIWVRDQAKLVLAADGQTPVLQGTAIDISDRKRTEELLRRNEAALRKAQQVAHIGSWEFDLATQTVYWSDELFHILGLPPTRLAPSVEEQVTHIFHPDDSPQLLERVARAIAEGISYELDLRFFHSDGSVRWLEARGEAVRDANGHITHLVGTALDITERKEADTALRLSEERYRAIVEDQTELIVRCLPDFTVLFVNEAYSRYFGINRDDIIGKSFQPLVFADDQPQVAQLLKTLSPDNPTITNENRIVVNGQVRWAQWNNRIILDDQGQIIEYQSVGQDITERKQAELALHHAKEAAEAALLHEERLRKGRDMVSFSYQTKTTP